MHTCIGVGDAAVAWLAKERSERGDDNVLFSTETLGQFDGKVAHSYIHLHIHV